MAKKRGNPPEKCFMVTFLLKKLNRLGPSG